MAAVNQPTVPIAPPEIPTVELVLPQELTSVSGISMISLVDRPAIGIDFVMMAAEELPKLQNIKLAYDEEKGVVTGPLLIPKQLITRGPTRLFPKGYVFYMTAETILRAVQLFLAQGKTVDLNLMHDPTQRCSGFIFETWIKSDPLKDKSEIWFSEQKLPVGTAFMSVQLMDESTKQKVRDGKLAGFSMEGLFDHIEKNPMPATPPIHTAMRDKKTTTPPAKKGGFLARLFKTSPELAVRLAEEMAAEADDIAQAGPVTVKADDGSTVTLTLDDKGEIACTLADGTEAMLQLSQPEPDDNGGPGATTDAVANPMDVAALSKEMQKLRVELAALKSGKPAKAAEAAPDEDDLMLKLAAMVIELKDELSDLKDGPASGPAKGAAASSSMTHSTKKTVAPKDMTLQEQVKLSMEERRAERLKSATGKKTA